MQYLRERLSLNLPQGQTLDANAAYGTHGSTSNTPPQNTLPKPPDGEIRDGKKSSEVTVSPTTSAFSGASFHSTQPKTLGTPPSAYSTPFQSPVASEKWNPHSQRVLPQQTTSTVVQVDKTTPSPTGVFVIDRGQFSSYPHSFATPVTGGYVNHSFANDSGNNGRPNQPQVIREQYWSWSCRCRRQLSHREKVMLLVIGFLLLIVGGLAAYLGIISNDGNPLQGGILSPGVLNYKAAE
ncbi:uncharacterized protein LOC131679787 isoform X2 [Topomyia yanbarensis]|uniref:uncharacterized protein LOC131679787 isoform X2 n=1 Tax=Topomyia yanbarensis TaxID=2498891 RepID=UPI00273BE9E8|nr:uncharacterized protein LOC131679787 isoform X2 [Topomyia yanbarensis]